MVFVIFGQHLLYSTHCLQFTNFSPQQDYELITNAKKLSSTDFTYNEKLGFISLNSELRNDQALAVAFEYTVNGKFTEWVSLRLQVLTYRKPLIVKLIRGRNLTQHFHHGN